MIRVTTEITLSHDHRRNVLPSELTNSIEHFTHVHSSECCTFHLHLYHTNVFKADNIYKNPPQMSFHLSFYAILIRSSGAPPMTLLTAEALPDPKMLTTASNVCTSVLSRMHGRVPPPPTKTLTTPVSTSSTSISVLVLNPLSEKSAVCKARTSDRVINFHIDVCQLGEVCEIGQYH